MEKSTLHNAAMVVGVLIIIALAVVLATKKNCSK